MKSHKKVLAALVPCLLAGEAWAQAASSEVIQVTGTRLNRAEAETALPVTVITKEDIAATGQTTVAEVLRTITFNTQGSSVPITGSTGQGVTDVNLRGLGFGRTLVLINGRRIPVDSAFFGFAVSTTFVPLGAVERIEILREGASAVYGSDALGGVVNIILRREFAGVEGHVEFAKPEASGGESQIYSLVAGSRFDRLSLVGSLEYRKQDPVSRSEREPTRSDFSNLGFGFLSNSFPPTFRATDFFGNGTNIAGPLTAASGCDSARIRTSPGVTLTNPATGASVTTGAQTECRNPTSDHTDLVPEFEVTSASLSGRFSVNAQLSLFLDALYSKQDSMGRSPAVTGTRTLAATNPNNPTRNATPTSPVAGVTGPRPVSVLFALPDSFGRLLTTESTMQMVTGGLEWNAAAGDLTIHYGSAKNEADSFYDNAVRTAALNAAIDSGALDLFGTANPERFAPHVTTGTRFTESKLDSAGVNWSSAIPRFSLPGGAIRYGLGYEWRKESLIETCDSLTGVFALTGAFCFRRPLAQRKINAVYAETAIPILKNLEVSLAHRNDDYTIPDFTKGTSRIAVRYQPMPTLVLRGGYAEGVRAPNLFEISSASGTAITTVIDTRRCAQAGGNPQDPRCQPVSVTQTIQGGPTLKPEESKSNTIGFVWSPGRSFNVSLDYYRIKVEDQIANLSNQAVVNLEAQGLDLSQFNVSVTRDANGVITAVTSGSANVPGFKTSGFDLEATAHGNFGRWGTVRSRFVATWVREFKRPSAPGAPVLDAVGFVNQPEYLFNWTNHWQRGAWSADLRLNYIGSFDARTPEQRFVINVADQGRIGAYETIDFFVNYDTPWKGRISVGARNIFDERPTTNRFAYGDLGYSTALHDVNGRVFVVRYTQRFR